jgi:hypothetical protein
MKRFFHNIKIEKIKNILTHAKRVFFATYKKRKRVFALVFISLFLLVGTGIYFQFAAKKAAAAWWNDAWSYRKSIEVANSSGSTLTDFQIKILDNKDLSADITAGKIQASLNDLRFTDNNGKLLDYWIEDSTATSTDVWIKIPTLPTSGATVYFYYGNFSAPAMSDGNKVFEFFDDFNGTSIDTSKWDVTGSMMSISGGRLRADRANGTGNIFSKQMFARQFVLDMDFYPTQYPGGWEGAYHGAMQFGTFNTFKAPEHAWAPYGGGGLSYVGLCDDGGCYHGNFINPAATGNVLYKINMQIQSLIAGPQGVMTYSNKRDDGVGTPATGTVYTLATSGDDPLYVGVKDYMGNITDDLEWDNWRIRKYAAAEPVSATPATEEKSPAPIAVWKFDEGGGVVAKDGFWKKTGSVTNLILNPSFENATWNSNWAVDSTNFNSNSSSEKSLFGGLSAKSIKTASNTDTWTIYSSNTLTAGNYMASAYVYIPAGGTVSSVCLSGQGYAINTSTCADLAKRDQWQRVTASINVVSTVTGLIVMRAAGMSSGEYLYQDGFQLETASIANLYCDGSLGGNGSHAWNAAVHASTSTCDIGTDGQVIGAQWKDESQCVSGKCLYFNGTKSDYVNVPESPKFSMDQKGFTYSVWIKGTDFSNPYNMIMGHYLPYFDVQSNGVLHMSMRANGAQQSVLGSTVLEKNKWYHVGATYDENGYMKVYVNGKQDGVAGPFLTPTNYANNQYIGTWDTNNPFQFTGFIDESKIYAYALSANQMQQEYNAGIASLTTASSASFGSLSKKFLTDGLLGYWKMDETLWNGTAGEVKDASGNNKNGTSMLGSVIGSGKFGNGGVFTGASANYVDVGNSSLFDVTNKFSVSVWFKSNNGTQNSGLVTKWSTGAGTNNTFGLSLGGDASTNKVGFYVQQSAGGTPIANVPSQTYTQGEWTHLVGVADGAFLHVYKNGIEIGTPVAYDGTVKVTTKKIIIGRLNEESVTYPFDGSLDEARIYNRALSPSEVYGLYEYAPQPIAYWKFDENTGTTVNDASGNGNTGTLTNSPIWSTGKYGSALNFNGSSNYVNAGTGVNPSNKTAWTISSWVYSNAGEPSRSIAGWWDGTNGIFLQSKVSGDGFAVVTGDGFSYGEVSFTSSNTWVYATLVYDGTQTGNSNRLKLYLNGTLQSLTFNSGTIPASIPTLSSASQFIGNVGGLNRFWNGKIDEVKVYDYARTQKQILEDMGGSDPASKAPIAYWKFNEGSGTTVANQIVGGDSATLGGAGYTPTWTNGGKFEKALQFDGITQYATIPKDFRQMTGDAQAPFTLSTWVKPLTALPSGGIVFGSFGNTVGLMSLGSGTIYFRLQNQALGIYDVAGPALSTNQWYHVVATFDENKLMKLYVNGNYIGQNQFVGTNFYAGITQMNFGGIYYLSIMRGPINAIIDETKIFNYALSSSEIAAEYNQGSTVTMASQGISAGSPDNSAKAQYCIPGDASSCNAPTGEWKFDENTGTTVKDTSSNGYNGTLNGSTSTVDRWTVGKINAGGNFNFANTDYVATTLTTDPAAFTVSAWAKIDASDVNYNTIFSKFLSVPYRGFFLRRNTNATDIQSCVFNSGTSYCLASPIDFGKWIYWTVRYDGSTLYLYKNGILTGSVAGTLQGSGSPFLIGANYTGQENWNGKIDQVTFYSYARTPAQIAYDYNRGKPIAWWKMDECQGNTLFDATGNGNNGTISIGASGSQTAIGTCTKTGTAWGNGSVGKFSSSMNFDGTDDFVSIPAGPYTSFGTSNFTVTGWVKTTSLTGQAEVASSAGSNNGWRFGTDSGYPYFGYGDGVHWNEGGAFQCPMINDNTWHHIAITYLWNNSINVYTDGKFCQTIGSGVSGSVGPGGPMSLGSYPYGGSGFYTGQSDDIRIYNYALTAAQIANVKNEGSALRFGN